MSWTGDVGLSLSLAPSVKRRVCMHGGVASGTLGHQIKDEARSPLLDKMLNQAISF